MKHTGRLFRSQVAMIVAVVIPLAMAERNWVYAALTALTASLGWWWRVRRGRPIFSPRAGKAIVIACFFFLIIEYGWMPWVPPVLALSHFMILVSLSKWLQRPTLRDDVLQLILSLLLLVVTAIVSGDLLFPIVLIIYLTIGLSALIHCHLETETSRVRHRNSRITPLSTGSETPRTRLTASPLGVVFLLAMVSSATGAVVFLLTPRVGAGMFGRVTSASSNAITGFGRTLDMSATGPVGTSNRPVMRVVITTADHIPIESGAPLYFRGAVLDQYRCMFPRFNWDWQWRQAENTDPEFNIYTLKEDETGERYASLLEPSGRTWTGPVLIQDYYLEQTARPQLFACYPPLGIRAEGIDEVKKFVFDQTLEVHQAANEVRRYSIISPALGPQMVTHILAEERGNDAMPEVHLPNPMLPRQGEILGLMNREFGDPGPLEEAGARRRYVEQLVNYLQSDRFQYTLNPPPTPRGQEPVATFLFDTHQGYCQHFASALAIMCQLKNIPARIVTGYLNGDYNPIGKFYLVRERHAHSWVEVFIPGQDWVVFDATPAQSEARQGLNFWSTQLRGGLDYLQFCWANFVVEYNTDIRRAVFAQFAAWIKRPMQNQTTAIGSIAAFVRELFGWRLKLTWRERLIYWVFALLIVVLALLILYVAAVTLRWLASVLARLQYQTSPQTGRRPKVEFYRQCCRRLAGMGLRKPKNQTPAEFAEHLAAKYPSLHDLPELIGAYYDVAYGHHTISASRLARIEDILGSLRRMDPSQFKA